MKRIITIIIATLFITLSAKGQNLFFIGEQSYCSTNTFTLESNSEEVNDLKILFGQDEGNKILGVTTRTEGTLITGKLIIYLDDGTVLKLDDNGIKDYVDETAKHAYFLTDKDLDKIKESNINSIRYTLDSNRFLLLATYGNFTASNNGNSRIDFSALVTEFFGSSKKNKSESNNEYVVQKEKSTKKANSAPYELNWEGNQERNPVVQPLPTNVTDTEATITIRFEVKPDGTAGRIIPLEKMNPELEREVMRTLRNWRFSRLPSGVPQKSQWGAITFRFMVE